VIGLGYGWALEQAGEIAPASAQYRDVLRRAVEQEQFEVAVEAGRYLQGLLSPTAADERAALARTLADVERRQEEQRRRAPLRPITPIVIPVVANAPFAELVSRRAAVSFDLDGSGEERRWQWITPQAGWLVYQGSGERRIDSGTRFIGSRSFWIFWRDGYDAMSALDDDGDGWLSGSELRGLAVWRDLDSNGVTEAGEVRPLGAWGIVALGCASVVHPEGFPYNPRGVVLSDGSVRPSYDWIATGQPAVPRLASR
jgi:hypothetical protein